MAMPCFDEPHCPNAPDAQAMLIVRYAYYCCLTFTAWEWMINIPFELTVIWRKSTSNWLKLLYACPRYVGLAISIGDAAAISYIHGKYKVALDSCQLLYSFQMISTAILLLFLEVVLLFRIFALFRCERNVGIMLLALIVFKTVAVAVLAVVTIQRFKVGDACLLEHLPLSAVLISAIELGFQTIIWCLTLYKHIRTHLEHGWQDIPLLSLVTRDGSWAFGLLLVIYVALLKDAFAAFIPVSEKTMRLFDISFPILITTISFVNCRMIKNMRKFSPIVDFDSTDPLHSSETGTIQLTDISSLSGTRY